MQSTGLHKSAQYEWLGSENRLTHSRGCAVGCDPETNPQEVAQKNQRTTTGHLVSQCNSSRLWAINVCWRGWRGERGRKSFDTYFFYVPEQKIAGTQVCARLKFLCRPEGWSAGWEASGCLFLSVGSHQSEKQHVTGTVLPLKQWQSRRIHKKGFSYEIQQKYMHVHTHTHSFIFIVALSLTRSLAKSYAFICIYMYIYTLGKYICVFVCVCRAYKSFFCD